MDSDAQCGARPGCLCWHALAVLIGGEQGGTRLVESESLVAKEIRKQGSWLCPEKKHSSRGCGSFSCSALVVAPTLQSPVSLESWRQWLQYEGGGRGV